MLETGARKLRFVVSILAVLLLCSFGNPQAAKKPISVCELDKFLCSDNLAKCTARNEQLEKWYADNKSKYDDLQQENTDLEEQVRNKGAGREMLFGGGLGLAIAVVYLIYRGIKKIWPPSSQHKQLTVLIVGAIWIAGASLYAIASSPRASASITELRAMVYSLPGVLFGGIGFWWFGRRIVVRLF
jgi:hypothetical protein